MSTFGKRLTELRKEKGLTQKGLAEELSITKNTISVWERDARKPEFETLTNLCSFFDVNMSYLLGEEVERTGASPDRADDETTARWALEDVVEDAEPFIKKYMQLGDEARQMINAAISAAYKYERANDGLFPMGKQVRLMIDREEDTGETEV